MPNTNLKEPEIKDTEENDNPLELSDEDFFKLEEPDTEESTENDNKGEQEPDAIDEDDNDESDEDGSDIEDDKKSDDPATDEDEDDKTVSKDADKSISEPDDAKLANDDNEYNKESETKDDGIDYKAEYEKLTAPFKANGTEMTIKSTEDAIRLMQMGANYQKKMIGLKPVLKTVKLLEKNNLMDPEKLNYLIDLNNQDPAAITKLLKDSQLDPLDINVKDKNTYTPTSRSVSDAEIELDQVLVDIQDSKAYPKTLNIVTKEWDENSKQRVAQQPQIISVINGHVESGIYDTVMGAVNYERSLGKLQGISDFDAYKQMGDTLHAAGKLGDIIPVKQEKNPKIVSKKIEKDKKRKNAKKAAQPNKSVPSATPATFNPLELSDAEFEKMDLNKFVKKSS